MATTPVFRFAPSPNGYLHLGHALSAILNFEATQRQGGRFLVRIEDIDRARARPAYEDAIFEDLAWLGLRWEIPVRRQSEHFGDYQAALEMLKREGLIYPCRCSRTEIAETIGRIEEATGQAWPRDPDGAPLYPGTCREASIRAIPAEEPSWRLHSAKAMARIGGPLAWTEEEGDGSRREVLADPSAWGDVVIARKGMPTSYHLSVVVDDALQGVTHVVRGRDLFHATAVHRLLQALLGLPAPIYRHHRLLLDAQGNKLAKSSGSTALRELRRQGVSPAEIRHRIGLV